ncbi:MAG: sigma-70 family RNA polymerase sigma factor [Ferruginibacter sp.]
MNSRPYHDKEDKELLELYYADKNNEWLGILLQRYTILLYGVCMKYLKNEEEAKDGVQQVFLKVLNELPRYKVEYFKSWLYMVAKNHCLMKLRGKGTYTSELNEKVLAEPEVMDFMTVAEKEKNLDQMAAALLTLNIEQQQCISMFYLEKKSYNQIAGLTGFTVMQVKSYIQNGKRNLKLHMERLQDNER